MFRTVRPPLTPMCGTTLPALQGVPADALAWLDALLFQPEVARALLDRLTPLERAVFLLERAGYAPVAMARAARRVSTCWPPPIRRSRTAPPSPGRDATTPSSQK